MPQHMVFFADRYNFQDGDRNIKATRIKLLNREGVDEADKRGIDVATMTGPYDLFNEFRVVPGVYDLDIELVARKGKMEPQIVGARFVRTATTENGGAPGAGSPVEAPKK